ncbi:MAG TPA: HAMP domain-containing sensor histidine kinase [Candidatus Limnocylindrales bacterium]
MPASLTGRIVGAFALLAVALWLAIGATMFVVLRELHADATSSALADTAQTLAVRIRNAVANQEVRQVVNQVRNEVAGTGITLQQLMADGTVVEVGASDPAPASPITVPADARVGDTLTGNASFADGAIHDYAVLVLRGPNATQPRAILLSTVDTSGATAVRDVTRTLPIVILVTLIVGAPLAILLSRSIARPLERVAGRVNALVDPVTAPVDPLPATGPKEVRELTERINVLASELARTRARESDLLADLRHDLRTPLTVIGGYATALADGTAAGEAAERAAAAIAEETARLERLVGELGAIDRLRTGSDALRPEPLDAEAVLRATADRFAAKAAAEGVALVVVPGDATPDGRPLALAADRVALDRILGNLVDNALAVLEEGGTIRLGARRVEDAAAVSGSGIAFSVADDGPGFPPGGTDRAFDRFYRGDPSRSGGGSGLGLAIVRELARAHGGSALAENLSPHGARVSVILPVSPVGEVGAGGAPGQIGQAGAAESVSRLGTAGPVSPPAGSD